MTARKIFQLLSQISYLALSSFVALHNLEGLECPTGKNTDSENCSFKAYQFRSGLVLTNAMGVIVRIWI
jgi:hypothetical protein